MENKTTYYERNKDKIKTRRRERYSETKQERGQLLLFQEENSQREERTMEVKETKFILPLWKVFLGILILFSLFLIWQGAVFFTKQGYSLEEAYVCSVFGELLLVVSSGLVFYSETKRTKQLFSGICFLSIFLLGAFLHNGVRKSLVESNSEYKRLQSEYKLTLSTVESFKKDKESQPENYKTKKQEIQNKIDSKLSELKTYSSKLNIFESQSMSIGEYYLAWIRIALMILNAYLVHAFLKSFLKGSYYA